MKNRYGNSLAVKEHLLTNKPLTGMEAIIMYGVSNLYAIIKELRRTGYIIENRKIPYLVALRRLNTLCKVVPPKQLPINEISITEYWINKN